MPQVVVTGNISYWNSILLPVINFEYFDAFELYRLIFEFEEEAMEEHGMDIIA